MTKTIEQGSNAFTTWLGNTTALPTEWIQPLFSIDAGFISPSHYDPSSAWWLTSRISTGRDETKSLFYNGMFYMRVMWPCWVGVQIRWAGKNPTVKEYLQVGLGWKLNGRFGALFRIQSDNGAAEGVSGPNVGQAQGWYYGTK